jgi:hypothetical protein
MKAKAFEFRLDGMRGLPRVLLLALITAVIIGVVALVVMVGVAVTVVGLAVSGLTLVWYAARRALLPGLSATVSPNYSQSNVRTTETSKIEAIDVEIEVLPVDDRPGRTNDPKFGSE